MTQQPAQTPLVAEALALSEAPILGFRGVTVGEWIAQARTVLFDLARQLEQADTRIAVLEMGDMTATAQQWELAFKREKELREQAEREKERLMQRCLEAERFDAQYENSRLPGDSALSALFLSFEEYLARNTKPSGEVGEEA